MNENRELQKRKRLSKKAIAADGQDLYRESLLSVSIERALVADICLELNQNYNTAIYRPNTLKKLSSANREKAINAIKRMCETPKMRENLIEIMFPKTRPLAEKIKVGRDGNRVLLKQLIESEYKDKIIKGETVPGGIRVKLIAKMFETHGRRISDRMLSVYLSKLEYSKQRPHSSDIEYGSNGSAGKIKMNTD